MPSHEIEKISFPSVLFGVHGLLYVVTVYWTFFGRMT